MPFGGDLLYWKIISKGILYPRGLREATICKRYIVWIVWIHSKNVKVCGDCFSASTNLREKSVLVGLTKLFYVNFNRYEF